MYGDLEALDSWDPLTEEYNTVAFNSYNTGPGANLSIDYLPPFAKQAKQARARTLCIKNVPVELTEVGLRNIFSCSGKVLCMRKLSPKPEYPDKTLAFVDYGTTAEALNAIQDFNDRPPFFLKVNIAMSLQERRKMELKQKEELEAIKKEVEETRAVIANYAAAPVPSIGRGRPIPQVLTLDDLKNIKVTVGQKLGRRSIQGTATSSSSSASFKTTRDRFTDSASSAAGDGPHLHICSVCGRKADRRCSICSQIYCSRECQVKDWPQHMKTCVRSVPVKTSSCSDSDSSKWGGFSKNKAPAPNDDGSPDVKPPVNETVLSSRNSPAASLENRMKQSAGKESPAGKPGEVPKPSTRKQYDTVALPPGEKVEVVVCYGTDLDDIYVQRTSCQAALAEVLAKLQSQCIAGTGFQPSLGDVCAAKFSEDQIWYRARVLELFAAGGCRVYFVDYGNESTVALVDTCPLPPGCASLPGQAVRCRLHGIRPKGGKGPWSDGACAVLAEQVAEGGRLFAKLSKVAADGKSEIDLLTEDGRSLGDTLKARGLAEDIPLRPGAVAPATSVCSPPKKPAVPRLDSRVEQAKEGSELLLQVTVAGKEGAWCLVLQTEVAQELHDIEEDLNATCPKLAESVQQSSISVGDYVASKSLEDGRWYRAFVLRTNKRERWVRYLDYGNDEVNTAVVPLPQKHLKAPSAAVRLLAPNVASLKVEDILRCVIISNAAGQIRATITVEGGTTAGPVTCMLAAWDHGVETGGATATSPEPTEQKSPAPQPEPPRKPVPPRNETPMAKVIHLPSRRLPEKKCSMMFAWKTAEVLFIQQQALMPELAKMMDELNKWAEAAKELRHAFDVGDYVCARFSGDNAWYRGKVVGSKVNGCYPVMFVDFGNDELVPQASLRILPPQFADQPLFAHCVIPDGGIAPNDDRLVTLLEEKPFAAVEVDSRAGVPVVQLVRKDGTSITGLLQPAGSKGRETNQTLPSQATKPVAKPEPAPSIPPCPVPSESFEARISSTSRSLLYVQPLTRDDSLAMITEALQMLPVENAKSCRPKDYVLARDPADGKWYRARVAAPVDGGRRVEVQLVDYGKRVEVPRETLKLLPRPLALDPACALAVELDKVPVIDSEVGHLLTNKVVTVEVVGGAAGKLKVRMMLADGACINDVLTEDEEQSPPRIPDGRIPAGRVEATLAHRAGNLLFLHLTANTDRLRSLLRQLNQSVPSAGPQSLGEGDVVCIKPADEKLWHRGRVQTVGKDGAAAVLLVDEGRVVEGVSKSELRCLPADLASVPAMGVPARLHGLPELSEAIVLALKDTAFLVEAVDDGPPPTVRIYDDSGECISDALKLIVGKKLHSPSVPPAPKAVIPERPFPNGRTTVTIVAASPTDATLDVQQVAALVELKAMMEELNASVPAFVPARNVLPNAYVCARYKEDGLWYRAQMKEKVANKNAFVVCFVDYGNCEQVAVAELRALPEKFLEIPLFVNRVAVQGVEKMTEQTCLTLANQTVCLEVADASEQPPRVKLFEENGTYLNHLLCM